MKLKARFLIGPSAIILLFVLAIPFAFTFGKEPPLTLNGGGSTFTFENGQGSPVSFTLPSKNGEKVSVSENKPTGFLSLFSRARQPVAINPSAAPELVSSKAPATQEGIAYVGQRTSDYYFYDSAESELKHFRTYASGNGREEETYTFKNTVLHVNEKGEIEGYYMGEGSISDSPETKGLPQSLLDRAQRVVFEDTVLSLRLHGGEHPDFVIPKPVAFDKDSNPLDVKVWIEGLQFNRLTLSFETSAYPAMLDPTYRIATDASTTILGPTEGIGSQFAYYLNSIATGDLNNDGLGDLAIGAYSSSRVYLFYNDGSYPSSAAQADRIINNVSNIGPILIADLNSDGRSDLILGGTGSSGSVSIFYQDGSWGTRNCVLNCEFTFSDVIINGEVSGNTFGYSIAVGDLNTDGRNDLAVGAVGVSSASGAAYFFYQDGMWGTATCTGTTNLTCSATNADKKIAGETGSNFGSSIGIGDLGGPDTKPDLAVGAHYYNPGGNMYTGRVYIFNNDGTWPNNANGTWPDGADTIITGPSYNSYFGGSLAVSDLGGPDTKPDLVVGAHGYNSWTGRVYLYYNNGSNTAIGTGCSGTPPAQVTCAATSNANQLITGESGSYFGYSLATGDLGGPDTKPDLAVSGYGAGPGGNSGRAYVFWNDGSYPSNANGAGTCTPDCADAIITGETGSQLGRTLAIGDAGGSDTKPDLVVGSHMYSNYTGRAYVFWNGSFPANATSANAIITGERASSYFGCTIATGDLTNDGKADLAVGAYNYNATIGRVYLFYNDGTYPSSADSADVIITGTSGYFGYSIAIGDLMGDSKNDLAVGANSADSVYLFTNDGSSWGTAACTTGCLASDADKIIVGDTNTWFGNALAIGDLGGPDTKPDLVVGEINYSTSTGRVYVFWNDGGAYSSNANGTWPDAADTIITGESTSNRFGGTLAIGDLGGPDTRSDLAVGAYGYSSNMGRVYIYHNNGGTTAMGTGCTGTPPSQQVVCSNAQTNANYSIAGTASAYFGYYVFVGDIAGDTRNDLAVFRNSSASPVYIYLRDDSHPWSTTSCTTNCSMSNADISISSDGNSFGIAMASGDLGGPSTRSDLAVASRYTSSKGRVYIFWNDGTVNLGSATCTGGPNYSCSYANADVIVEGDEANGFFGQGLAIGDVMGTDDRADLVAGSYSYNYNQGKVAVFQNIGLGGAPTVMGSVQNQAPSITGNVSDGGSSAAAPTNVGNNVTFSATTSDSNGDPVYLAVCKIAGITAGSDGLPTCSGTGGAWVISEAFTNGSPTVSRTALVGDTSPNAWVAYVCDKAPAGQALCTSANTGSSDTGTPFAVNHRPVIGSPIYLGSSFGSNTAITPANGTALKVTTAIGTGNDAANAVVTQPDGKIVVAGSAMMANREFALTRYNSDGSLDTTFSGDGKVTTTIGSGADEAYGVALQADGKIVVVGQTDNVSYRFAVARYSSDGTLDTDFSGDGMLMTQVGSADFGKAVAIQSDGKIVVVGVSSDGANYSLAIVRYNSDGTLDTTFSSDGWLTTALSPGDSGASAVAIDSSGRIVVAGTANGNTDFSVARFNSDGTFDNTFSGDGIYNFNMGGSDEVKSIAIDSDGKIVVAGYAYNGSDNDFAVARLNTNGTLDTTFSDDGMVLTPVGTNSDQAYGVAIQDNGKIVVAGHTTNVSYGDDFGIVRYNSDGTLDTTYGTSGKITLSLGTGDSFGNALALQLDNKAVVAGTFNPGSNQDFGMARFTTTGVVDLVGGGDVYVQVPVTDSDSDTSSMYVCSTNDFTGGRCAANTLCAVGGVASGSNAQCVITNVVPIPTASGTNHVYTFIKDIHGFVDSDTAYHDNTYTVANALPTLLDYTGTDASAAPVAGGSNSFTFKAHVQDNNGEGELTEADGVLFEDTSVDLSGGTCTPSEQTCYLASTSNCTLNTAYGTNTQVEITCTIPEVWFNATPSGNWEVHINPSDGTRVINLADSNLNISVGSIGGVSVVQDSIAYGSVYLGMLSDPQQSVEVQNAGNVIIDVGFSGTDMTYNITNVIGRANQHWSDTTGFGYNAGYALVEIPASTGPATGCFNANLPVATSHDTLPSDTVYWRLLVPEDIKSGTYTGSNNVSIITCQ